VSKKDLKDLVTTGPSGSAMFAPIQENLVEPQPDLELTDDFERCINCGYCRQVCRVYNTTFNERDCASGRNRIMKALSSRNIDFDKQVIIDAIYRCMLCGNCHEVCPVGIDTLEVFHNFRRESVKKGAIPDKLVVLRDSIVNNMNPFLESGTDRFNWCSSESCNEGHIAYNRGKELAKEVKSGISKESTDDLVGYFVGCTSAYRNNELVTATSRVLDRLGVKFMVFPDEVCCGSVLFRTGMYDDAVELAKQNIAMIRELGIKTVVFSCAGCLSTFTREYNEIAKDDLGFDLYHLTQYVPKIAKEKNIKIKYKARSKDNPLVVTYHDPCHLVRFCDIYEEPRELINMIEGVKLIEMKHNKKMSWCCGAGGGVRALYGEISTDIASDRLDETVACWEQINEDRLKEALETKAETLVSACVFCKNNLHLASTEADDGIPVRDLSQILEDCEFSI
jgi:Fe-S oxidoreductase